jgi:putative flippase GtrA
MNDDIFDRIMELNGLRILNPFYKKHKEVLLYLFFGGLTFIISMVSYTIVNIGFCINELIANLISWILAVLFAFFTNRIWVFQSVTNTWKEFWMQMINFMGGRVATLIVEELILFVFITILSFNSVAVKLVAQIIVILFNYLISKFWVFNR